MSTAASHKHRKGLCLDWEKAQAPAVAVAGLQPG